MPQLDLYSRHTRERAIARFGPIEAAKRLCDGQWLIFGDAALCLAHLGSKPDASHFETASQFCWVAERHFVVSDRPFAEFVPAQVVGPEGRERDIHLFAQPPEASDYIYLGTLEPSYSQSSYFDGRPSLAHFHLSPALPAAIWEQIGGPAPGAIDASVVDDALARLRGPTGVAERLDVLRTLVGYWHGPITADDGMTDAELEATPLPDPLRWWYGWAGRRSEIMSGQNFLLEPQQLKVEDGKLPFHTENQSVYDWSTLPSGEDPPVFGRYSGDDGWRAEGVTLCEHLILTCLSEAIAGARYGALAAWVDDAAVAAIAEIVPPIAIGRWRWVDTRFHAGGGVFMMVMPNGSQKGRLGASLWIGAKSEQPLQFLRPYLDDGHWEHVAF